MPKLPATFRPSVRRLLVLLVCIIAVSIGIWAFPMYSSRPLVASHVLIGLVAVIVLMSLCALLIITAPVSQTPRRDFQRPTSRHPPRQALSLTHRQRRHVKR